MEGPVPANASGVARLLLGAPGYVIGQQEVIYVPNPAAGQFWRHTVDGRYHQRLITVTFTLSTSAVVANRFVTVQLADNNGRVVAVVPAAGAITANSTAISSLTVNGPAYASATAGQIPGFLPDIMAAGDWVWSTVGFNLDAADQFSAITLLVHRYPNDATSIPAAL